MAGQYLETKPATPVEKKTYPPGEEWRIIKNILVLGFAFMIHFTAFHGTANLQSSVNADAALGTFTLASIYGSLILSNIFLPVIVISWFGCKWTVAISFLAYMPFIAAQFWPRVYTLIPAGLMVGFGGGPLWCAKCTYLSVVAEAYSQITGMSAEMLVVRFFGLFFMFYQMAQVWGNLISSAILSSASSIELVNMTSLVETTTLPWDNDTLPTSDIMQMCGAQFCAAELGNVNPNLEPPPEQKIQLITGIYLACMVVAVLAVTFGVDSLNRYSNGRTGSASGLSGVRLLAVTLRQLRHKYQLLLLPVTAFVGAEQAFMAADFTAAFVACAWGISNIGYVMICFGVFNAIAAVAAGALVKLTGRYPVMVAALLLHISIMLTLLYWEPTAEEPMMFFVLAALWGTADGVWLVQVNALSGILFPGNEEASYSNFRLWEASGSVVAYALSPYLCTSTKLYSLLALLLCGMAAYSAIELAEYRAKQGLSAERDFELVDGNKERSIADIPTVFNERL